MEKQIKYSIIIPHFNIPQLLERCLYSIPQRDDVQIIVVDDNSADEYLSALRALESKFTKAEFVYLEYGGGGGKARNVGLGLAIGEYILFADADDFFNYCLDAVLDDYKNETADIVFFASNSIDCITYQNSNRADSYSELINDFNDINDSKLRYDYEVPWGRLVRRSFLDKNTIRFQETVRHNDVGFSYNVGFFAKSIKVDRRAIYCVTTRSESTSKNESLDALKASIFVYANKYTFLTSKGINCVFPIHISLALYNSRNDNRQFNQLKEYAIELGISPRLLNKHYKMYVFKKYIKKIIYKFVFLKRKQ